MKYYVNSCGQLIVFNCECNHYKVYTPQDYNMGKIEKFNLKRFENDKETYTKLTEEEAFLVLI